MLLETLSTAWRKVRATNATDNGYPSRLIRATEPSGTGNSAAQATASAVFENGPSSGQNLLMLKFFGAGSNNATCGARVIGWNKVPGTADPTNEVWEPTVLAEIDLTLSSTPVGLAGKIIAETDLFADTLVIATGYSTAGCDLTSPTGDVAGHALVDLKGSQKWEVTFTTKGSATNVNALAKLL